MTQADLLRYTIKSLEGLNVPYMLVGSFASGLYGEPRFTRDIDIVIALRIEDVPRLIPVFPDVDFYLSPQAAIQAVMSSGQFNVIHPESGNKIDFMVAGKDEWGESQMSRRRKIPLLPDLEGYAGAPEDIIISKMRYYQEGGSEKHLRDIAGVLKLSGSAVNREYVARWSKQFGLDSIWNAVQARVDAPANKPLF